MQEERAAEALALLDGAIAPSDPKTSRHWRLQRALALVQLGRTAEARTILDELETFGSVPPALVPLLHWRRVLLALAEGDAARASDEAERMERTLADMGPEAVPEHAIMARFDLAKFWSGQGALSRAFAHWTVGHKLLAMFQPFSRDRHRAFVDASIEAFSGARMNAGVRATNRDPAPVFIVGMPRSGTTLVEQILAAHRDVFGAGERPALGNAIGALEGSDVDLSVPQRIAALDREALDRAAEGYLAELHALAPRAQRIVDKMPGNFLYLGLVGLLLPSARIIHCVRDPRDIGLSIFTFRFHGAHGYAHDLADLGWYIGEHDRLMAHWKSALPNPILTVRLDDWVADFDATLERVLDHLELPPDASCARFYELDAPRADGELGASPPTDQRSRSRALGDLRLGTRATDRGTRSGLEASGGGGLRSTRPLFRRMLGIGSRHFLSNPAARRSAWERSSLLWQGDVERFAITQAANI